MKLEELLKREQINGFNINQLFKQFDIIIKNPDMLDKVSLLNNDRIDNISHRVYENSKYWWILYLINFDQVQNLAMLNTSDGVLYNMVKRSLKSETPDILLKYLENFISKLMSNLTEVMYYFEQGNLVVKTGSDKLYGLIFGLINNNLLEYQKYFKYNKRSFDDRDESLQLEDDSELVYYKAMFNKVVLSKEYSKLIDILNYNLVDIEQIDLIGLTIEESDNLIIKFANIRLDIKLLKYIIKEIIRWCNS